MSFMDFWEKTSAWLRTRKTSSAAYQPEVDDEGLIYREDETEQSDSQPQPKAESDKAMVKTVQQAKRAEPIEKLQEGFNRLIGQLEDINRHLNQQAAQHEELTSRIDRLPKLLETFPGVVENQKKAAEQLLEQLRASAAKDQQFLDSVERIPNETAKQTDALVNINHQLAAAADTDVQMTESFNKFNQTVARLNQAVGGQAESIVTMSKTFATSDRYLKYLMSRQNRRFMWIFLIALGVCVFAILLLTGIIIYLRQ